MIHEIIFVAFFSLCSGIQYIEIARSIESIELSLDSMNESFVTYTDDIPFEKVILPVVISGLE